jgi:hypothetical protein
MPGVSGLFVIWLVPSLFFGLALVEVWHRSVFLSNGKFS